MSSSFTLFLNFVFTEFNISFEVPSIVAICCAIFNLVSISSADKISDAFLGSRWLNTIAELPSFSPINIFLFKSISNKEIKSNGFFCFNSNEVDSEIASFTELVTGSAILLIASIISEPTSLNVLSRSELNPDSGVDAGIFWLITFGISCWVLFCNSSFLSCCIIFSSCSSSEFESPSSRANLTASWPSSWDWEKSINFL